VRAITESTFPASASSATSRLRVVAPADADPPSWGDVRDDVDPGARQVWNEDAAYGAGGARDEDGGLGGKVHRGDRSSGFVL